ncbi:cupredoxin domain-containing protein [Effusibacillus consociatus]|uniref:Cupredoxin domain-containing protein n=1 Tax=Effusibacillus consociatus TaxID=1117041 RepID=A0ABV9Q2B6_9BACL
MTRSAKLFVIAAASLGILAGCGGGESASTSNPVMTGNPQEVKIAGSNYKFEVTQGELKAGQPVKLTLEGKAGVHGYKITDSSINETVKSDEVKTVTWTPEKSGEYFVVCSVPCGSGHSSMQAKIVVK